MQGILNAQQQFAKVGRRAQKAQAPLIIKKEQSGYLRIKMSYKKIGET